MTFLRRLSVGFLVTATISTLLGIFLKCFVPQHLFIWFARLRIQRLGLKRKAVGDEDWCRMVAFSQRLKSDLCAAQCSLHGYMKPLQLYYPWFRTLLDLILKWWVTNTSHPDVGFLVVSTPVPFCLVLAAPWKEARWTGLHVYTLLDFSYLRNALSLSQNELMATY